MKTRKELSMNRYIFSLSVVIMMLIALIRLLSSSMGKVMSYDT